ncbi:autotransporter family protein [Phycisphaera mikurensis]|uniref:Autotransporter domain-containing protein n=1 Tax=Phycisphaera mikurensis (strain NBRC 102666 / KCTC 22515 / FYK2301M01) TaxID=1142394 RepID=I0IE51_PHYMF|nr:autotransporter outer membrane beta-barrel domain-containing protein [Phycisphaera mikurensis]MBB6441344.1 hypothetical protein [Phycisphaera mikurensis]BAM03539.1 hypothetical protein PSMK_13800 [Phycisphaera mikurensis NBRC 102666]
MPIPTPPRPRFSTAALLAAASALHAGVLTPEASGQVEVTTLADSGTGSLREALGSTPAGGTITFAAGLDGSIDLSSELSVGRGVTIDGSGANRSITIDGGGDDFLFLVNAGSSDEVRLKDLTLRNGLASGGAGGDGAGAGGGGGGGLGAGGAIFGESGVIILDNTLVEDNAARGGNGGNGGDGTGGSNTGGTPGDGSGDFDGGAGGAASAPGGDGEFGSGGGGGGASAGAGGAGAGEAGGGADGQAVRGGGGGGGSGLGGGVFLTQDARLVLAGDGSRFGTNTVTEGQGGNPPGQAGASDGQDGGARGESVATIGTSVVELRPAAGERLIVDTDGFASVDGTGSGSSVGLGLQEGLTFRKTGLGSLALEGTGIGGGVGAVAGDFDYDLDVDEGSFNPGGFDRVGTTVVGGDFSNGNDGVLDIEFGADGVDRIDVGGDIRLNGDVNFIEVSPGVTPDTPLTFLQTTDGGTLSDDFDAVRTTLLTDSRILAADVTYRADGADVTFAALDEVVDFAGDDPLRNREKVGELLNDVAGGERGDASTRLALQPAFDALLDADDLGRAVLSQANTTASAALAAVPQNQLLASGVALARLNQGGATLERRNRRLASANASRLLAQLDPADVEPTPYPVSGPQTPVPVFPENDPAAYEATAATLSEAEADFAPLDGGPALFAEALGVFSDVEEDNAAPGQDSQTYGVAFGGDWALEDWNAVGGVYLAFTETETGVDGLGDDFKTDAFQVGLYGAKRFDDHLVVNGTASAGFLEFESERPTPLGTAEADADGFVVGATVEALYDLPLGDRFIVSPLVGVETYFVDRDGYAESGAGALNLDVDDSSGEFLTSVVGAQLATAVDLEALGDLRLSPLLRVGWSHQHLDREGTTTSAFAAAPGESFTTRSSARDRDALRLGAALELGPAGSDDWAVYARYTGDIAANGDSHTLRAGLRISF